MRWRSSLGVAWLAVGLVGVVSGSGVSAATEAGEWVRQFGVSGSENGGTSVAVSGSGVYAVGFTTGALPGQASAGGYDALVRRYGPGGNVVWSRQFGTGGFDVATSVAVDGSGVYVAGTTDGVLPGQVSAGGFDVCLRRYDADGEVMWTRQFGTSSDDWVASVAVDGSGVYVTGTTDGAFPGYGAAGESDVYLRRYDLDGNVVWTRQFGTTRSDGAAAIAVHGAGVFVAGGTYGTLPGETADKHSDAFVRRYDLDGNVAWTRQFGTRSDDWVWSVAVDASGVYVAGSTGGVLEGETAAGGQDVFVRRYDLDGDVVWSQQFGTEGLDDTRGVAVAGADVFVAGTVDGALQDGASAFGRDVFVRRYERDGSVVWTRQFDVDEMDWASGVATDGWAVYVTGHTVGVPWTDAFVARLLVDVTCGGKAATIYGTQWNDDLTGTAGDDVIVGLGGDDVIKGFGGDDFLCGGDGDDVLLGGPGADSLDGGDGKDRLRGAAGDDLLDGGPGPDRLLPESGNDTVNGGAGSDLVDYLAADGPVVVDLTAGTATYTPPGDSWTHTLVAVEKVDGSSFDDVLRGDGKRNVLRGKQGADQIWGYGGDDDLIGGLGVDVVHGGHGDDLVKGQADDDALHGEADADKLVGGNGNDSLYGGLGDDLLIGGLKSHLGTYLNTLDGGDGFDTCRWELTAINCES